MRILAIRGENLASLARPFEIDLGAEPLAGTGLFAITGDTGAGKSTILDALCLALYGDFPRAKVDRREEVIDPSGKKHQVSDPRHILRRGTGHGYAEVDFIGQDAKSYRARWQVRRTRGRATGNLQKEERRLDYLDGSGTIATGKTDVREAVIDRTGFTFDQFCRTVLLAQGEFDAFLLAGESERAELLEKITGTQVYSHISIRVFEKTKQRREELQRLQQSLRDIGLMDEEARQQLMCTQAQHTKLAEKLNQELDRLSKLLHCAQSIQTARNKLAQAQQAVIVARSKSESAIKDRLRLEELAKVAPLRAKAKNLNKARANQINARSTVKKSQAQLEAALAAQKKAIENQKHRHREEKNATVQVKKFEPIWSRASQLDEKLNAAQGEYDHAQEHAVIARQAVMARKVELEEKTRMIEAAKQHEAVVISKLEATKEHATLAQSAAHIEKLIESRTNLSLQLQQTQNKHKQAKDATERLGGLIKKSERQLSGKQNSRDHKIKQLEDSRTSLKAIDEQSLAAKYETMRDLQDSLIIAQNAGRQFDKASEEEISAQKIAKAAKADRSKAIKHIEAIVKKHGDLSSARREVMNMVDLAEATLSSKAAELRSVLNDKEPCPVCGATDHPIARGDDAHAALAASIKKRRHQLDRQLDDLDREIIKAKENRDEENARLKVAQAALKAAKEAASTAVEEFESVRAQLIKQVDGLNLKTPLPGRLDDTANAALAALFHDLTQARNKIESPLNRARLLRNQIDADQREIDTLNTAIEKSRRELAKDKEQLHTVKYELAQHDAKRQAIKTQLRTIDTDLVPFLRIASLDLADIENDAASAVHQLKLLATQHLKLLEERETIDKKLTNLKLALSEAKARFESVQAIDSTRQAEQKKRQKTFKELQHERAQLLDGEATNKHRARTTDGLETARRSLEKARLEETEATNQVASLKAHHELAKKKWDEIKESCTSARKAFEADCAALKKTTEQVLALLDIPKETQMALQGRIEALDRDMAAADNTVTTRREDLDKLVAANPSSAKTDLDSALQEHARQKKTLDELREELGRIRNIHETEEKKRARAQSLTGEIAAGQKDLQVWLDIDAAIGQKDGAKFRRFAQSVTLGNLIQLANDQLKAISKRYRLGRTSEADLALHVVDHDMDEEVRASHSLSGGERFLVSLALALALAGLEGRQSFVDTLFIDEGFGSLDRDTLDMAIDALETLQGHGRKVGVITHVPAMIERIATQVRVEKRGNGRSLIRLIERGHPEI